MITKSGYVSIIGKPNAGKSTLMNKFLDFKFTAKNRAIKFSNRMDSRIQGVIMPMTRL